MRIHRVTRVERGAARRARRRGLVPALRDAVFTLTASPALAVVLYVLAVTVLHEAGAFPLAFYSGYVLEHRYGLSRQALRPGSPTT